jgi:phosphate transport system permease protein
MAAPPNVPAGAAGDRPEVAVSRSTSERHLGDVLFWVASIAAAVLVPLLAVALVVSLVHQSMPSIQQLGWGFLIGRYWEVSGENPQFGALPFIYGTLLTSFIALVFAAPLGIGAAAFLSEVAPGTIRRIITFLIELLAAIPSVIYGFWGLMFLVPIFQKVYPKVGIDNPTGEGYFTAGVLLALMIVPYITAISFDVCRAVPTSQRQAALALGTTRWQLIRSVVLPYARGGIIGACFLALGRALGETMAVAMLIGNLPEISPSIFGLGYSIPAVIATELGNSSGLQQSALVELGLVLLFVTVIVNVLARLLLWNVTQPGRWRLFRRRGAVPVETGTSAVADEPRTAPGAPRQEAVPRTTPLVSSLHNRFAAPMNALMTCVLGACAVLILIPLFHILYYVSWTGLRYLNLSFFTHAPLDDPPGLGNALVGSLMMVGMATVAAVPLGILAALFLTEYRRNRLTPAVRFIGEVLLGVPSVVLGLFAFAVLVVPFGHSAWAGAFALAVMMIPIVMRSSEEALKLVPESLRNASYALGASRWQTVLRVMIPSALPTVITGVCLGIARIIGETAPLLFTAFNSLYWPQSPNAKTPFLTYYIYNGATGTFLPDREVSKQLAWEGAVVLLSFVMLLNIGIRMLTGRRVMAASRAD